MRGRSSQIVECALRRALLGLCLFFLHPRFVWAQAESDVVDHDPDARSASGDELAENSYERVSLFVTVLSQMPGCPTAEEIVDRINGTVGWDFAQTQKAIDKTRSSAFLPLELRFRRLSSGLGRVDLLILDESGHSSSKRLLRSFEQDISCAELSLLAALKVSLLAETPEDREAPGEKELTIGAAPSSPEEAKRKSEQDAERIAKSPTKVSDMDGRKDTTLEDEPEKHPFKNWTLGFMAVVTAGELPGVGLGGGAFAAYEMGPWSVGANAALQFATGANVVVEDNSGQVVGFAPELWLRGCRQAPFPLKLCIDAGYTWFLASGRGFSGGDEQNWVSTAALGLSLGTSLPLSRRLGLGLHAGAAVPLSPLLLEVNMEESGQNTGLDEAWSSAPIFGRFEVQLTFR